MGKDRLVKITEQSFQEAGGRDIFGKLKMLGPVYASVDAPEAVTFDVNVFCENMQNINKELIEEAKKIGARYVFDVKYEGLDGRQENTNVRGTAYKIKGPIRKFIASFR